ncbi:hypothetical protein A374_14665 [Fictibacillus macauensis ZFHKF-1]|uniref:Hydrolase n=1 Tax=Fictibacillus macauensis ZFHKF-1 TaxID=1196324 RepID=I8AGQ7_9BACL|nr:hypothetical protein [Fictibacillus macauensis]EIT84579.1 hypothetical protein A374_14665 [Fictibacillus macauensis ZFHKF-1]
MGINERFFCLDGQWNVIHLPERPNGFGIMLFGDRNHYVDETCSLWKQHKERHALITALINEGYTVFYSHLYGKHWGSKQAVMLAKRVYRYVMKFEILNPNIHMLAEGMGALAALGFIEEMPTFTRSAVFLNPCVNIGEYLLQEKQNQLFHKRIRKEIGQAYQLKDVDVEANFTKPLTLNHPVPLHIFHEVAGTTFPFSLHSRPFEQQALQKGLPVSLSLQMPKEHWVGAPLLISFYKLYEKNL